MRVGFGLAITSVASPGATDIAPPGPLGTISVTQAAPGAPLTITHGALSEQAATGLIFPDGAATPVPTDFADPVQAPYVSLGDVIFAAGGDAFEATLPSLTSGTYRTAFLLSDGAVIVSGVFAYDAGAAVEEAVATQAGTFFEATTTSPDCQAWMQVIRFTMPGDGATHHLGQTRDTGYSGLFVNGSRQIVLHAVTMADGRVAGGHTLPTVPAAGADVRLAFCFTGHPSTRSSIRQQAVLSIDGGAWTTEFNGSPGIGGGTPVWPGFDEPWLFFGKRPAVGDGFGQTTGGLTVRHCMLMGWYDYLQAPDLTQAAIQTALGGSPATLPDTFPAGALWMNAFNKQHWDTGTSAGSLTFANRGPEALLVTP